MITRQDIDKLALQCCDIAMDFKENKVSVTTMNLAFKETLNNLIRVEED